jgi:K+-sensing histidine kinase KdpD
LQTTNLSRHQRELVNSISLATNATTEMLHTLLDYSRIEAGVVEAQREHSDYRVCSAK